MGFRRRMAAGTVALGLLAGVGAVSAHADVGLGGAQQLSRTWAAGSSTGLGAVTVPQGRTWS